MRLKRRAIEDPCGGVGGQEARFGIVARQPESGLGEVVGSEGEERGLLGQVVGDQACARQLDHRADDVVRSLAHVMARGDLEDQGAHGRELAGEVDERDHHLKLRALAGACGHGVRRRA